MNATSGFADPAVDSSIKAEIMPQTTEAAPLLVATPLYGTEPETVTFDEGAVLPAAVLGGDENDPLFLRASASADFSAAHSDKPEEPVFRDVPFAVLFWMQFIAMVALGCTIAPKGYEMVDFDKIKQMMESDPDSSASDVENFEGFIAFIFDLLKCCTCARTFLEQP